MREPLAYDICESQEPQILDWTCSACSLAWLNRALSIDFATDEQSATEYIGAPEHINSSYGLMDGSGLRLAECLREQGAPAICLWPTWSQALQLASAMPLLIGGVAWNHWVGVSRRDGDGLCLANSAEGWMGIYNYLTEADWNRLGPFAVVAVPLLRQFPPPSNA